MIRLVGEAIKAPSSHNAQPWLFELEKDQILLIADRTRALPANDPGDRELTISCGAALFNLRVAAAAAGDRASVELLPDGAQPDLVGRVRIDPGAGAEEGPLGTAIEKRRTSRKPFRDRRVEPPLISALTGAVEREGAWLHIVEVGEGRRELAAWMRPRRRGDGMALFGFVTPLVKHLVSTFDLGGSTARKDRKLTADAPLLAVLGTKKIPRRIGCEPDRRSNAPC